jgi:hypothetical protein
LFNEDISKTPSGDSPSKVHFWYYSQPGVQYHCLFQALAHDVLDLTLNRVVVEENAGRSPAGGAKVKTRACDLDSRDRFWMAHKGSPFPTVAEAIQEELEQYRASEEEVKRLKASMVGDMLLFHIWVCLALCCCYGIIRHYFCCYIQA